MKVPQSKSYFLFKLLCHSFTFSYQQTKACNQQDPQVHNHSLPSLILLSPAWSHLIEVLLLIAAHHGKGLLPEDIYSQQSLVEFLMSANSISSTIQEGMISLIAFKITELSSNKLSNLEQLHLHINNFSGSVPASLMNCRKLVEVYFAGQVSARLGHLQILNLGNNRFTGNLPESLFSCKSLNAVRVVSNKLTGTVSLDVVKLPSLTFLSFSNNSFTNVTEAITVLARCKSHITLILSK
ncbi:Tyrosine-sulfated glycopeptide receptor 1 [Bienertia sinuspersici]